MKRAKLQPLLSPHQSSLCLFLSLLYKAIPIISYKNIKNFLSLQIFGFSFFCVLLQYRLPLPLFTQMTM